MSKSNMASKRASIENFIVKCAVGPLNGDTETINTEPSNFYISNILFPIDRNDDNNDMYLSLQESEGKDNTDVTAAEQVSTLSGKIFPSSMGLHVYVSGERDEVSVTVNYALYEKQQSGWKRIPQSIGPIPLSAIKDCFKDYPTPKGPGYLRINCEQADGFFKVKVYFVNDGRQDKDEVVLSRSLYQPRILIRCTGKTEFLSINNKSYDRAHIEDRISKIQFRKHQVYGRGYGCAAEWNFSREGGCREVATTALPAYEIHPLRYDVPGASEVLDQHLLSFGIRQSKSEVVKKLYEFIEGYSTWIKSLSDNNPDIDKNSEEYKAVEAACLEAAARMRQGVHLIETNDLVCKAFMLANLAMMMQSANRKSQLSFKVGDDPWDVYKNHSNMSSWRPFQLAFLLLSIDPSSVKDSQYRESVDLIWFPTGGGKTEAYLGVMAFVILYQRLQDPGKQFGTTVISRYTMRLLTAQQFERAASLVSVLDIMSKLYLKDLGGKPVTLGIWHGPSPKYIQNADEYITTILKQSDYPLSNNKFPISYCPVCNTALLPVRRTDNPADYCFNINGNRMEVICPSATCPMHAGIPVCMVDEQIYNELPTVVIGTIDKFARLAWKREPGWLLTGKGGLYPSPSLIIQDELHLIAGPLGSLAGVYESAIDVLCSMQGAKPHIIASTATVRRAEEQTNSLYARTVKQFPPPGLDEADNYFAKKDSEKTGRKYLGLLSSHLSPTTAAVRVHALLLQAAEACKVAPTDDQYFTLVSYFNSVKELGVAATLAADDIPDRLKVVEPDVKTRRKLEDSDFEELYSERKEAELGEIMRRMYLPNGSQGAISLLLSTNIISVGIDVDRLGLMLVNGQPKSTAEYIQASSRVGRSKDMPGLIVTLYGATKPRDRSHYENFIHYHSTLYNSVEPTSVTPFSKPSRERALHAVMVILARNLTGGLPDNSEAKLIPQRPDLVQQIKNLIEKRVRTVAKDEVIDTINDVNIRFDAWISWAADNLYYEVSNAALKPLLHREIAPPVGKQGWHTMDSMRNVDFETKVIIQGDPRLAAQNTSNTRRGANGRRRRN